MKFQLSKSQKQNIMKNVRVRCDIILLLNCFPFRVFQHALAVGHWVAGSIKGKLLNLCVIYLNGAAEQKQWKQRAQ